MDFFGCILNGFNCIRFVGNIVIEYDFDEISFLFEFFVDCFEYCWDIVCCMVKGYCMFFIIRCFIIIRYVRGNKVFVIFSLWKSFVILEEVRVFDEFFFECVGNDFVGVVCVMDCCEVMMEYVFEDICSMESNRLFR